MDEFFSLSLYFSSIIDSYENPIYRNGNNEPFIYLLNIVSNFILGTLICTFTVFTCYFHLETNSIISDDNNNLLTFKCRDVSFPYSISEEIKSIDRITNVSISRDMISLLINKFFNVDTGNIDIIFYNYINTECIKGSYTIEGIINPNECKEEILNFLSNQKAINISLTNQK